MDGRIVAEVVRAQATPTGPPTGEQVYYLHRDLQGSTTLLTDAAGNEPTDGESWLRDLYYDPFGRRLDATDRPLEPANRGGPRIGFTGKVHDDELGLVDYGGRVYDPTARRFLTPDPFVAQPFSSQGHNRYAYVGNNPTTYTDPTGYFSESTRGVSTIYGGGGVSTVGAWWRGFALLPAAVLPTSSPMDAPLISDVSAIFRGAGGALAAADSSDDVGWAQDAKAPTGTVEVSDTATVCFNCTDWEIIGRTIYMINDDGYWIQYPWADKPVQVSRTTYYQSRRLAGGGVAYDAMGERDWTIIFPIAVLVIHHLEMAILDAAPMADAYIMARGAMALARQADVHLAEAAVRREVYMDQMGRKYAAYAAGVKNGLYAEGHAIEGLHAEISVSVQLGPGAKILPVMGFRRVPPITGPLIKKQIPVCVGCQGQLKRTQFADDVLYEPGGAWSE